MASSMTCEAADKTREAVGRFGEKADTMLHGAQDAAATLTRQAKEGLKSAKDGASGYVRQGREQAEALGRAVEGQVKEWPLSAILVATGIGVLMGVLVARR